MASNRVESILRELELRYTKEVSPTEPEQFFLPFDTPEGVIRLHVFDRGDATVVTVVLRSLDTLSIRAPRKELFLSLLRLNGWGSPARVFVWTEPEDEIDWIAVTAEIPEVALSAPVVDAVVAATAQLASEVLQIIATHVPLAQQKELGPAM